MWLKRRAINRNHNSNGNNDDETLAEKQDTFVCDGINYVFTGTHIKS